MIVEIKPNTHTQLQKDNVIYTHLKIKHISLTHKYILTKNDKLFCVDCNTDLTIKHILTNCTEFNTERKKNTTDTPKSKTSSTKSNQQKF